jgi:hypothetical protein
MNRLFTRMMGASSEAPSGGDGVAQQEHWSIDHGERISMRLSPDNAPRNQNLSCAVLCRKRARRLVDQRAYDLPTPTLQIPSDVTHFASLLNVIRNDVEGESNILRYHWYNRIIPQ